MQHLVNGRIGMGFFFLSFIYGKSHKYGIRLWNFCEITELVRSDLLGSRLCCRISMIGLWNFVYLPSLCVENDWITGLVLCL